MERGRREGQNFKLGSSAPGRRRRQIGSHIFQHFTNYIFAENEALGNKERNLILRL
jgi:hypothetical protein